MTPEQRQAARERCEKATPADSLFLRHNKEIWRHLGGTNDNGSDEDFDYNARTDLPAALDALDAAEARIAELQKQYVDILIRWALLSTKEQRERLRESERIPAEIWNMVLENVR
jgi:hypothetical protein